MEYKLYNANNYHFAKTFRRKMQTPLLETQMMFKSRLSFQIVGSSNRNRIQFEFNSSQTPGPESNSSSARGLSFFTTYNSTIPIAFDFHQRLEFF